MTMDEFRLREERDRYRTALRAIHQEIAGNGCDGSDDVICIESTRATEDWCPMCRLIKELSKLNGEYLKRGSTPSGGADGGAAPIKATGQRPMTIIALIVFIPAGVAIVGLAWMGLRRKPPAYYDYDWSKQSIDQ
jgi:hypothetical protein